jgi:peptidoglycan/xylan/chitin deacetylase (PgdA/CDA1 family)
VSRTLIICYHAVSERWPTELAVTPSQLEWQIRTVIRRGYRPVTFAEAMTESSSENRVSITFDDAYLSVLELAAPVLRRFGVPGSVYAPTDWIDRGEPMHWPGIDEWMGGEYEPELIPMSWEQLRTLQAEGWEVGSHSVSHPHLTRLDDDRLAGELKTSKEACEAAMDRPCRTLAYPYGDVDDRVIEATLEAGYEAAGALSASPGASGHLSWPRVAIYRWDDRLRYLMKLSPTVDRLRRLPTGRVIDPIARRMRSAAD